MSMLTKEQIFINNYMKHDKNLTTNALNFYHELIKLFKISTPLISSSKKLAASFGKSERSIQRYVKLLKSSHLLHTKPIWNTTNPDKKYIEETHYYPTPISEELQERARLYVQGDRDVNFSHKATT